MKRVFTNFPAIFLIFLGTAVNAQNSESFTTVNLDKTTLPYYNSPELTLWENVATQGGDLSEINNLEAVYNLTEHQIVVKGTKVNGDVEVWDVNGKTVAEKRSNNKNTVLKVKSLPSGTYYIGYSNGNYAEGTKLVIR